MSRAPFQVLVFPFKILSGADIRYAVFKREIMDKYYWQAIAGGGEDDETPLRAARREVFEEAGIDSSGAFVELDSMATIPVIRVCGFARGPDVLVILEYCFGVRSTIDNLQLCGEHIEYKWLNYEKAFELLSWDSNKNALWELNHRLRKET
jgi:dATP pyrophosphohydrolase